MMKTSDPLRVLIAGGSGLVGSALNKHLSSKGMQVRVLSRNAENPIYRWNPAAGEINGMALEEADIIINLAGANIAGRLWTRSYKKLLRDSRIQSTRILVENLKKVSPKPRHFIQASAIGFYENGPDWVDETSEAGKGFLAQLTRDWELEAAPIRDEQTLLSIVRLGIVLKKDAGFLGKMAAPAQFGLSAALGSGKQHISWIHIQDLVAIFSWIIEKEADGIYNACAGNPVSNKQMTAAIAQALHRPYFLPPVPAGLLKFFLGDLSTELLSDHRVSNKKLQTKGFVFRFNDIDLALTDLLHG
ncbi:MAG: TIGR01777 family oxidoreductase [Bacteroidia bacterium]